MSDQDEENLNKIRSSFRDLVIYNDQGQPALDLNRLVYTPPTKKHKKEKEKLFWYVPDYAFTLCNFLSLTYATYYVLNGVTIITWRNTMHWFRNADCFDENQTNVLESRSEDVCAVIKSEYGGMEAEPYTMIRFKGFVDPSVHGLVMLSIGVCTFINVIAGVHACLVGIRSILAFHLSFDIFLFLVEVAFVVLVKSTGHCEDKDIMIIAAFLQRMISNYAANEAHEVIGRDTMQMDLLQISLLRFRKLTCCGVANWSDYLPRSSWDEDGNITKLSEMDRYDVDQSDLVIPSSCCNAWWARNIYCGHEAHMWAYPSASDLEAHQFRQRITQIGCLPKMVSLCTNMVSMVGTGGIIACGLHFLLSIGKQLFGTIQIRRLDTLIRERKRIFKHRNQEAELNEELGKENIEDLFPSFTSIFGLFGSSQAMFSPSRNLPNPPGEKEMANYKARRSTNALMSKVRESHVGEWINSGKRFVEGQDGKKPAAGNTTQKVVQDDAFWNKINEVTRQREEHNQKTMPLEPRSAEYAHPRQVAGGKRESVNALDAIKLLQQVQKKPVV